MVKRIMVIEQEEGLSEKELQRSSIARTAN
jgi:hypothetical protein